MAGSTTKSIAVSPAETPAPTSKLPAVPVPNPKDPEWLQWGARGKPKDPMALKIALRSRAEADQRAQIAVDNLNCNVLKEEASENLRRGKVPR